MSDDDNNTVATNESVDNSYTSTATGSLSTRDVSLSCTSRKVLVHENFESWKKDGKRRYLLAHLLCRSRVEEKMTLEKNASDAVVWNILHLTTNANFPQSSPTVEQRVDALVWLNNFKRFLNKVIASEVRMKYCYIANQDKWTILKEGGESFSSFADLVQRTKYSVGKEVCI